MAGSGKDGNQMDVMLKLMEGMQMDAEAALGAEGEEGDHRDSQGASRSCLAWANLARRMVR